MRAIASVLACLCLAAEAAASTPQGTEILPPRLLAIPGVRPEGATRIEDADRFRIWIETGGARKRVLVSPVWQEWQVRGDTLVLADRFLTHRFAIEGRVERIEVPGERKTSAGARRGFIIGTIAGVLGTPMIIYRTMTNSWRDDECDMCLYDYGILQDWAVSILMGAGIGAATGAIAGSLSQEWEVVYRNPALAPPEP